MTDHAAHLEQFTLLNTTTDASAPVVTEEWGVYNDPDFLGPRFDSGEIHPALREEILEKPLYTSPIPGSAKRFLLWTNENRAKHGKLATEGAAILQMHTITRTARRTVTGQELEDIDEGRRPNG